ncbi:TRAP transporter substrate-binding protein [Halomonas sp. DP5Y7-2]|uniref:TRAP transporter substrate-binding protein n=1 Tax=Halomonas sp. DP5Y7-2 TaxID=2859076 RepID=UPI001C99BA71|nr:TRAP transporter substrate-binding protein [Halomonas sp. DP5Y7-2]MBY5983564.1 TRAP transporter substrate-binding protein [Halomonas sp. DP5Y7-2]
MITSLNAFAPTLRFTALAALAGGCVLGAASVSAATLTFAHTHPVQDAQHKAAERFAELVNEGSDGELEVRVFPSGQLGSDTALVSGVRSGSVDIALTGNPYYTGLVGELNVLDLPFLFDDYDHAYRVLDGDVGQSLLDQLGEHDMTGLAFWEIGFRNLTNSRRAVETAADIEGLKLRTTPNPAHIAAFQALGANPTPMPFTELFTSLETRTVDGQENPVSLIRSANFYEVQDHLSLTAHAYTAAPLVMNKAKFEGLPEDQRRLLVEAAREAASFERALLADGMADDLAFLKEQGMQVVESPDRDSMREAVADSVRSTFADEYGSELIDAIVAAKAE